MNWLDLVFLVIVIISGVVGLRIGLIRAALGALGAVVGILIASQISDDVGSLYASYISSETLANVIAYGLVILASMTVAGVLTIFVRKLVYMLFMGWVDKVAGLALGLVAGTVITWAAIGGLAELTYNSDLIDRGLSAPKVKNRADALDVKAGLENALVDSAFAGIVLKVVDKLPANALGFVPCRFMAALDILEERIDS